MTTGYCFPILKDCTLKEFILGCARAVDYLAFMRDERMDAPIPDEAPGNQVESALQRLHEAQARQLALEGKTDDELRKVWATEEAGRRSRAEAMNAAAAAEAAKLEKMAEQVRSWNPPTPRHQSLKSFMLQQIDYSIPYRAKHRDLPLSIPFEKWKRDELGSLHAEVEDRQQDLKAAQARQADSTQWIKELKESL